MAHFLRVTKQTRWYQYPDVPWLAIGELQGDALRDLETSDGILSVYEVSGEDEQERVAVALAAHRKYLDVVDYAIFDDSNFNSIGIVVESFEGLTPDGEVNQRHYNLKNLTIRRVSSLAEEISMGTHSRILRNLVKSRINQGIASGRISWEKLQPELLQGLQ